MNRPDDLPRVLGGTHAPRPYRVWGYPILPVVFILSSAVILISSFTGNLRGSLLGSALALAGLPLFEWIRRRGSILPPELNT